MSLIVAPATDQLSVPEPLVTRAYPLDPSALGNVYVTLPAAAGAWNVTAPLVDPLIAILLYILTI